MPSRRLSSAAAALGRKGGAARSKAKAEAARRNGAQGGRPVRLQRIALAQGPWLDVHTDAALVGVTAAGRPALLARTPAAARWLKRHGFTSARHELRNTINPPAGWNGRCWA
jgi:hypothetical protein